MSIFCEQKTDLCPQVYFNRYIQSFSIASMSSYDEG